MKSDEDEGGFAGGIEILNESSDTISVSSTESGRKRSSS
jgi:hypothetical protein